MHTSPGAINAQSPTAPVRRTNIQHLEHKSSKMHRCINQQSSCGLCECERECLCVFVTKCTWKWVGEAPINPPQKPEEQREGSGRTRRSATPNSAEDLRPHISAISACQCNRRRREALDGATAAKGWEDLREQAAGCLSQVTPFKKTVCKNTLTFLINSSFSPDMFTCSSWRHCHEPAMKQADCNTKHALLLEGKIEHN